MSIGRCVLKIFAGLVALGCAALAIALLLLWLDHRTAVTLPQPSGRFAVGRTRFDWIDASRTDSLSPEAGVKRELIVWVWYPAASQKSSEPCDYVPPKWRHARADFSGILLTDFITKELSRVRTHCITNADVSSAQPAYPVVLMKSGLGAEATDYSTLAENLASHGYVVVASDSPYSTSVVVFPDGRVVTATKMGNPGDSVLSANERDGLLNRLVMIWSVDNAFVLDRLEQLNDGNGSNLFKGRLNLQRIGVFGHSFGGATAAEFCRDDPRCTAGVDIDGAPFGAVVHTGMDRPFMLLLSDHGGEVDPESLQIRKKLQSLYNGLPSDHRFWIRLLGTRHFNFSDQALLKQPHWLLAKAGALGPIDARRGLQVTATCVRTFFDVYLKGAPVASIRNLATKYPNVQFEK
ncbi:MAG: hypothetical protein ABI132_10950 [Rhodanobacteraceae bacterium]